MEKSITIRELNEAHRKQILADVKLVGNMALQDVEASWKPIMSMKFKPIKL